MSRLRFLIAAAVWLGALRPGFAQSAAPLRAFDRIDGAAADAATLAASDPAHAVFQRSFAQWNAACALLPSNRSLHGRWPKKELLPLAQFREFEEVLNAFFAQAKAGALAQTNHWVDRPPRTSDFFNTASAYFMESTGSSSSPAIPFEPFVEKLVVPEGAEVFFRADLHGDIRSLLADLRWLNEHGNLRDFTAARTNFYMVFLGDYTDRGAYGVEVLYTLLRLKLANPERVVLLRGNHEEFSLQRTYGFLDEGKAKYGRDFDARKVVRAYDFLPVALYLGSAGNFIQCNHGGMEPGFKPRHLLEDQGTVSFQFLGGLEQHQYLTRHPEWLAQADAASQELAARALHDFRPADPISPSPIGFMWNDFSILASEPQFSIVPGRSYVYGARATEFLLRNAGTETHRVQAVFRGHQQSSALNPMMCRLLASRGVFRHWQASDSTALLRAGATELEKILEQSDLRAIPSGSVWTFNVSPDSVYGEGCGYSFDAFGILEPAREFADWRLHVVNVPIER